MRTAFTPPTSSSDVTSKAEDLPQEDQLVVIHGGLPSRLQKLSASLLTAFYLGAHSAVEEQRGAFAFDRLESSTSTAMREISSARAILDALNSQPLEELHDGMTLELGAQIASCLNDFGDSVLEDLVRVALREEASPEALSHAMRWVARLSAPQVSHELLLMLIRSLEAPSTVVRDGAALGLVELGSAAALPALEAAIEREATASLREDLEQAARYLRSKV